VSFLWHFPWGRPRRALPGTVPPWSPDFPPPAHDGERPSGRLASQMWAREVLVSNCGAARTDRNRGDRLRYGLVIMATAAVEPLFTFLQT
jgi:hypothetical protein